MTTFWSWYISILTIGSLIALLWLLFATRKGQQPGQTDQTLGHAFDGIEEFDNPLPKWWFMLFLGTLIFAAGYLARPLGGIVMAHYGDKRGRKRMFTLSVFLMAVPTLAIGLLPVYAQIGLLAPLLLLLLRVVQGIAVGGEVPGAWVFVAEHVPPRRGRRLELDILFLEIFGIFLALEHRIHVRGVPLIGDKVVTIDTALERALVPVQHKGPGIGRIRRVAPGAMLPHRIEFRILEGRGLRVGDVRFPVLLDVDAAR